MCLGRHFGHGLADCSGGLGGLVLWIFSLSKSSFVVKSSDHNKILTDLVMVLCSEILVYILFSPFSEIPQA